MNKFLFLIFVLISLSCLNCQSNHEDDPIVVTKTQMVVIPGFEKISEEVLTPFCVNCHSDQNVENQENNIYSSFETYNSTLERAVIAGLPDSSPMLTYLTLEDQYHSIEEIDEEHIEMISTWILFDAPELKTLIVNTINDDPRNGLDGTQLYDRFCAKCHQIGSHSNIEGVTVQEIKVAIGRNKGNMAVLSFLKDEELYKIVDYLSLK